jgi:hypothetical protein
MKNAQKFVSVSINCINEVASIRQPAHSRSCRQQTPDSIDIQQHCKTSSAAAGNNHVTCLIYSEATEVENRRGKNAASVTRMKTLFD